MAEFLVELYVARTDNGTVTRDVERARRAARELSDEGTPVRYLRSLFVPEDETCFFLYEAPRLEDVREAARRARLPFERVIACFAVLVAVLVLAGCGADGPASKASAASARPVSPASGS